VYRLTGKFDEAEKCYARALELKPEYAELHASIGALYIHQGNYHQALTHLEKAVRLDKNLAVAWANLSLACATVGEFERAESSLKKAVVLGYENAPSLKKRIDDLQALSNRFSLPRTAPAALENDETAPEQKTA
jgi:tetratricopeptide (TPR) repeat protein